jgi:hypothetical protein
MVALAKLEANEPDIVRILKVFANKYCVRILCRLAANKKGLPFAELTHGL